jgi:hypothetical protein
LELVSTSRKTAIVLLEMAASSPTILRRADEGVTAGTAKGGAGNSAEAAEAWQEEAVGDERPAATPTVTKVQVEG